MKNKTFLAIILTLILISIAISLIFYHYMPAQIASHWDINGEVNGYLPRFWGVFIIPIMMIVLACLFILIPYIDPLKKNIHLFIKDYYNFITFFILFLLLIHIQVILWNIGIKLKINIILPIFMAILFYYIGNILPKLKRNWTIGIRTPWTLSNDKVWNKTHIFGAKVFKIIALITLLALFFPKYVLWFIFLPIIIGSIITVVYSYIIYKQKK